MRESNPSTQHAGLCLGNGKCSTTEVTGRQRTQGKSVTGMGDTLEILGTLFYAPSAERIDSTIDSASRSICSFDSASIITRARASVPE